MDSEWHDEVIYSSGALIMKKSVLIFAFIAFVLLNLINYTTSGLEKDILRYISVAVDETTFRYDTRVFEEGSIVVFTPDTTLNSSDTMVGFVHFKKEWFGWQQGLSGTAVGDPVKMSGNRINYVISDFDFGPITTMPVHDAFQQFLLWGEISSSDVAQIEVVLKDGTVMQDDGSGMVFAIPFPKSNVACEIRLLDNHGMLIESISPVNEMDLGGTPSPTLFGQGC